LHQSNDVGFTIERGGSRGGAPRSRVEKKFEFICTSNHKTRFKKEHGRGEIVGGGACLRKERRTTFFDPFFFVRNWKRCIRPAIEGVNPKGGGKRWKEGEEKDRKKDVTNKGTQKKKSRLTFHRGWKVAGKLGKRGGRNRKEREKGIERESNEKKTHQRNLCRSGGRIERKTTGDE